MKRQFNTYITAIALSAAVSLSGCSKFLEETDPSNFSTGTFYTKPEHAKSSVNAIYASMRDPLGSGFGGGAWNMLEFATGLAGTDLGQAANSYFIKDLTNTAENGYGLTLWTAYYRGIANANSSLKYVPGITMDEAQKTKLLGEAYFLRAWYYFNLVQMFGKIPIVTEPVNLESEQLRPAQSTVEEVYNLIVSDLQKAEQAGLPWKDESGRVSTGAIKSLLAKVYLTMAGYPLQKGVSHYTLAAQKAKEVMESGAFKLFDNYRSLRDLAMKNKDEHIFMIQYLAGTLASNFQVLLLPYNKNISAYSDETGGIYATTAFAQSFQPNDLRAKEKQFFFTTFTHQDNRNQVVDLGGYFIYKYFDTTASLTTATSGMNWPVLRYADVLLMFAEATNEVSGPSAEVYNAVNAIRDRAELADLTGLTKDQLREAIWKERWYELCFENITWFDMVRLRKAFNVGTKQFDEYVGHKFSYGPTLKERELLFPIPTSEVLNGKLEQNLGY